MIEPIIHGLKVRPFTSRSELIDVASAEMKILIAVNSEKILNADYRMRLLINNNIAFSDGIGAVWALRKKGYKDAIKIPGCELWLDIIRTFYCEKTFYLVGGTQNVIEATVKKLKSEFSGIKILNFRNGYFSEVAERDVLLNDIQATKPEVVFVALGSPKQEFLMGEMRQRHTAIYLGLGGSFDVYTGSVQRAPSWWVRNNLEWAYRLIRQPSRIKRQIHLIRFIWLLFTNKL